jgi:hypothetical protein
MYVHMYIHLHILVVDSSLILIRNIYMIYLYTYVQCNQETSRLINLKHKKNDYIVVHMYVTLEKTEENNTSCPYLIYLCI